MSLCMYGEPYILLRIYIERSARPYGSSLLLCIGFNKYDHLLYSDGALVYCCMSSLLVVYNNLQQAYAF